MPTLPLERLSRGTARMLAVPLAALLALVAAAPAARAQVEDIEPRWIVVTRDAEPMRCGELPRYYVVAELAQGTVLRQDGVGDRGAYARVRYPDDVYAYARAADTTESGNNTVTTTAETGLRAINRMLGLSGSWRSVYLEPLPIGTELRVVEPLTGPTGQIVGYTIVPPRPPAAPEHPHGFVRSESIRPATPDEVDRHLNPAGEVPASRTPAIPTPAREPSPQPDTQSGSQPAPETGPSPSGSGNTTDTPQEASSPAPPAPRDQPSEAPAPSEPASLLEDMVVPTAEDEPAPSETQTPDPEAPAADPAADAPLGSGTDTAQDVPAAPPSPQGQAPLSPAGDGDPARATPAAAQRAPLSPQELEAEFNRVRRLGSDRLDDALEELLAEYERTIAATDDIAIADLLRQRVEWLELRIDVRNQRRALDAALERAAETRPDLERRLRELRAARVYQVVGRLVPSTLYDGGRLPLMYRVVAAGESGGPRTLGYIRGESRPELRELLGRIVGVSGRAELDPALRLRVIDPIDIDPLEAEGGIR